MRYSAIAPTNIVRRFCSTPAMEANSVRCICSRHKKEYLCMAKLYYDDICSGQHSASSNVIEFRCYVPVQTTAIADITVIDD